MLMKIMRIQSVKVCTALAILLSAAAMSGAGKNSTPAAMSDPQKIMHVLNRLTFGQRPGDVEQVRAMGVERWIDLQLHPTHIADLALDAKLARFHTLNMSTQEMVREYPPPFAANKAALARAASPEMRESANAPSPAASSEPMQQPQLKFCNPRPLRKFYQPLQRLARSIKAA